MKKSVFFISDRTAITTEGLGNALLTQFDGVELRKEVIPFVDTIYKADQAIIKINNQYSIDNQKPIVITTIIDPNIRNKFKLDFVCHIDLFEMCLPILENEFQKKASNVIGQSHGIIDEVKYYKRIDAIDYSIYNDDGTSINNFAEADVILIGVSRVGKTPTCLYLAINYGIKAANYPLIEDDLLHDKLPKSLLPYHDKLFGLTIDPERLHHIRSSRLPNSNYANMNTCIYDINKSEDLMRNFDIPFLNTSKKSIEEISVAIMQIINLSRKF
jgi:regulator of PEP synthase PpsR (kinase-PPPase family)